MAALILFALATAPEVSAQPTSPASAAAAGPEPWAVLSHRDQALSGRWGDFRVGFSRVSRSRSAIAPVDWVLDQTFTVDGVIETHTRMDSRTCPGLNAIMAQLPMLDELGPYQTVAPPIPEEPLQTLQSIDDGLPVSSDSFRVSFYRQGAMGAWTRRLFKLPARCWTSLK